jgi:uncharacterized integral membrane protein
MSYSSIAVEAALMQGEKSNPFGIVLLVVGVLLLATTKIVKWRKRRREGQQSLPDSFLDEGR